MNLLLDTHVALSALTDCPWLPAAARALIADVRNTVWVSSVSVWEIAIKHSFRRAEMPISGREALDYFRDAG
jgi:PIN domain nuclease of toxin-antitoxin system